VQNGEIQGGEPLTRDAVRVQTGANLPTTVVWWWSNDQRGREEQRTATDPPTREKGALGERKFVSKVEPSGSGLGPCEDGGVIKGG